MPVQRCMLDGKPGYRWGEHGRCYTYTPGNARSQMRARLKAEAQGAAIYAQQRRDAGKE